MIRSLTFAFAALAAVFTTARVDARPDDDWLHWRGPHQTGVSDAMNLPDAITLGGDGELWTYPIAGRGTPVIAGDRVYTLGYEGEGKDLQEILLCLDARTGERIWEWSSGTNGALTRPVVTPAGLLVASSAGTISLVDPVDGVETWSFRPGYQLEGISAPPTVAGRQLLFVTNAGFLHSMIAPARNAPWPPENRIDPLWERPRERRSGI